MTSVDDACTQLVDGVEFHSGTAGDQNGPSLSGPKITTTADQCFQRATQQGRRRHSEQVKDPGPS